VNMASEGPVFKKVFFFWCCDSLDDLDADESIGHDRLLANIGNKYVYRFVYIYIDLWGKLPKHVLCTLPFFTYPYMLFFLRFPTFIFYFCRRWPFFSFLFSAVLSAPDPPILIYFVFLWLPWRILNLFLEGLNLDLSLFCEHLFFPNLSCSAALLCSQCVPLWPPEVLFYRSYTKRSSTNVFFFGHIPSAYTTTNVFFFGHIQSAYTTDIGLLITHYDCCAKFSIDSFKVSLNYFWHCPGLIWTCVVTV